MSTERVAIQEWRVVNDDGGGISFTVRTYERDAKERAERYCFAGYHLELWEGVYETTPTRWRRVEPT